MRSFDTLLTAGERRLAVATAASLPPGVAEAGTARELAARIESRLVRGRGVTLRVRGGAAARFASLPATLGRDPLAEVTLRDPGVSRRHAIIRRAEDDALVIEDLGSRGGVYVAGARLGGAIPLRGEGELALGATTPLRYAAEPGSRLALRGVSGLDRDLVAILGPDPLDLFAAFALEGVRGLSIEVGAAGPRLLRRSDVAVRVDGHFVGPGCDLLHGDVVEVLGAAPLTLEVA
jgi:hypothetical protein